MRISSLWHLSKIESVIKEEEIFPVNENNILLTALFSCISLGTENLVSTGLVPEELYENMKVNYMEGSFKLPVKYGYSVVAKTEHGELVHVMHPHQTAMYVNESHIYKVPEALTPNRAALISNMETCLNAIWDAQLDGNERILVIGFGGIGSLLCTTLKQYSNINPYVFEINQKKLNFSKSLEFNAHEAGEYDVIFHTTATQQGLQFAIDHLNKEGKIIELSWYGLKNVNINLGSKFHYNRGKIISSQVSTISPYAPVNNYIDRKKNVCEVLKNSEYDELIEYIDFANATEIFRSTEMIKIPIIKYQ